MGGYGSGRWNRWVKKPLVENCICLDINILQKQKLLDEGLNFSLVWVDDRSIEKARLSFVNSPDALTLHYQSNNRQKPMINTIKIDWTNCHFGGQRPWFMCPYCGRLVLKLYIYKERILCRDCHSLVYSSQRLDSFTRLAKKIQQTKQQIGFVDRKSMIQTPKPKGMHWKTFFKLQGKLEKQEYSWAQSVAKKLKWPV